MRPRETFGWRAKIGLISPAGDWRGMPEYQPIVPDGVLLTVTTLGVERLGAQDAQKVFAKYPETIKYMADQNCDLVIALGALVFSLMGWEPAQAMLAEAGKTLSVPLTTDLGAHFEALDAFKAKKIVLVSPYEQARNEERKTLCEKLGYRVLAMKGLGIQKRSELGTPPTWASYVLSKEAVKEAPDCEAIYISCPEWPTVRNIEQIEQDTGKPVVAHAPATMWAAYKRLGIGAIRGYGKLLEML